MTRFLFIYLFFIVFIQNSFAQTTCQLGSFQFLPTTQNKTIDWQKFPEFSMPFSIIYGGPRFDDTNQLPLKHGFSHLSNFKGDYELPKEKRAVIWYGVADLKEQPWGSIKSPWNNNLEVYKAKWKIELNAYAKFFRDTDGTNIFDADLLLLDVESQVKNNDSILVLKTNSLVPNYYKTLDSQAFTKQYKQDLQNLYAEPIAYTKANFATSTTKISSYADTPILNTYLNIAGNSWQKWTSDNALLSYLTVDLTTNNLGGNFYQKQDYLTPSAYYYYDYPNPNAADYLAYLLFQIEANKAWSSKKMIPFVWLRYSASGKAYDRKFIQPFMAEATAIFPFFSGADGLWLWDDPTLLNNENYATYEYFINGLYRLSQYKDMFTGNYKLVIQTPAREYIDAQKPIWRGVAKDDEILITAQNPYAKDDNEITTFTATYNGWQQGITLKGRQVFLCKFSTKLLANEEENTQNFTIFPNPTTDNLTIKFISNEKEVLVKITDLQGKNIYQENCINTGNEFIKILKTNQLANGIYLIEVNDTKKKVARKFIKQ